MLLRSSKVHKIKKNTRIHNNISIYKSSYLSQWLIHTFFHQNSQEEPRQPQGRPTPGKIWKSRVVCAINSNPISSNSYMDVLLHRPRKNEISRTTRFVQWAAAPNSERSDPRPSWGLQRIPTIESNPRRASKKFFIQNWYKLSLLKIAKTRSLPLPPENV